MPLLAALLLSAAASERPLLAFHGNVTLVEDIYRSVLDLPKSSRPSPELARSVASRLRRFLHQAGYVLATVQARAENGQIIVDLDEGHLDKVAFIGADVFQTLRLKMDLHMPEKVLNKPELERQLKSLSDRLHLAEFAYELVPSPDYPASGPQLDQVSELEELSFFMPGFPYELHILVVPGPFHPGLSPQIEINSLEGGGLGLGYNGEHLFQRDDRWRLQGRGAFGLRDHLDPLSGGSRPVFTHANAEVGWDGPPFRWMSTRLSWRAAAEVINRQRRDLNLESVEFATLSASLDAKLSFTKFFGVTLGGGLERRFLFAAQAGPTTLSAPPVDTSPIAQTRPFVELIASVVFNPEELRRDRKHTLDLQARSYAAMGQAGHAVRTDLRYEKLFPIGWHELWLTVRGAWLSGDVLYTEEQSLGSEALRDVFSNTYARKIAGAGLEFRWSLLRDLFKVGLFDNIAAYGALDRLSRTESQAFADSFGLGVHALFIDEFQLDLYFGVGFRNDGAFGSGASLQIRQAF
jgi:hypothetical protein